MKKRPELQETIETYNLNNYPNVFSITDSEQFNQMLNSIKIHQTEDCSR